MTVLELNPDTEPNSELGEVALVESALSKHLAFDLEDGRVKCICGETFAGPVYHRWHQSDAVVQAIFIELKTRESRGR